MIGITLSNKIKTILKGGQGYTVDIQTNSTMNISLPTLSYDEVVLLRDTLDELSDDDSVIMTFTYNCSPVDWIGLYAILGQHLQDLDDIEHELDMDSYRKHIKMMNERY